MIAWILALQVAALTLLEVLAPTGSVPSPFAIIRGAPRWLRRQRRYTTIGVIALRHGLGRLLGRSRHLDGADGLGHEVTAARLRAALTDGGVTFVKLGQTLATRADLLPAEYVAELSRLHSDVAAEPWPVVRRTVEAERPLRRSRPTILDIGARVAAESFTCGRHDGEMTDPFDMTGRVAVVTGGSRGLGREMVLAFAERGADVVIASRKLDNCEAVATEVRASGRTALPVAYHAASWADADRLAAAAYEEFGRVDVLVNNAGMSPLYPSVDAITEDLYDKVMGVNLKGPFRLSAVIGTRMAAGEGGSIIFVSSIASHRPTPNELVYGAAKAGVNNLTNGLAKTFGPKVRVNCIVPGPFLTDISKAWDLDDFARRAKAGFSLERGGQPHEIVGAALYFASDASSYTTGATLDVDGGPR